MVSFDSARARRLCLAFFVCLWMPCCVHAFSIDEKVLPKDMEYRAVRLFKATRCLVCSGESLHESKSSFAMEMREFIRNRIASGDTDEEILRDLQSLYGEQILVNISYRGYAHILWLVPLVIAVVTGLAMLIKLRTMKSGNN